MHPLDLQKEAKIRLCCLPFALFIAFVDNDSQVPEVE